MKNIIIILIFLTLSCSSGSFKLEDRREGIEKGILRVYIREEFSDAEGGEIKNEKKIREELLTIGNERAVHLILSYIRANINDPGKYSIFDDKILKAVERNKIMFKDCNDDFCEIFIDYTVKELMDEINSHRNNPGIGPDK